MIANVVIILISVSHRALHRSVGGPKSLSHIPNLMRIHFISQFNHIVVQDWGIRQMDDSLNWWTKRNSSRGTLTYAHILIHN